MSGEPDTLDERARQAADDLRAAGYRVTVGMCVQTEGAAALLGPPPSPKTLRNWRHASTEEHPIGPPWIVIGRSVWYDLRAVLEWRDRKANES